jgi:hypothetical protein
MVHSWQPWTQCTATCGTSGIQQRQRFVARPASNGGKKCPTRAEERQCNVWACPTDCVVSDWGGWGQCSRDCGGGFQVRTREMKVAPRHGGIVCPKLNLRRVCNTKICLCSHVRCQYRFHVGRGHKRIQVFHDKREFMGEKHSCGLDLSVGGPTNPRCECKCFAETQAQQQQWGFNATQTQEQML